MISAAVDMAFSCQVDPIPFAIQESQDEEPMDLETDKAVLDLRDSHRPNSLFTHLNKSTTPIQAQSVQASDASMNKQHQMLITPTQAAGKLCLTTNQYKHLTVYNKEFQQYEEGIMYYELGRPVGCALIIGSCPPLGYEHLPSTLIDKRLMKDSLEHCGFQVYDPYSDGIFSVDSCKHYIQGMEQNLKIYSYECFLFYYTGHGNDKGMILSDGNVLPYSDIVKTVSKLPTLKGKPKIFIFDSCRKKTESKTKTFFNQLIKANKKLGRIEADTLICYSANEGDPSYSSDMHGSFYTEALARMLMSFGKKLTLTEIVQLVHGWTKDTAILCKRDQQPVMYCTLEKLLVFCSTADGARIMNETFVRFPSASQPRSTGHNNSQFVYIKGKGDPCAGEPSTKGGPVDTDAAGKGRFKTKADVTSNLQRLGKGVSVFVCYLPDPTDPYSDRGQEEVIKHLIMIRHLIRDLERLGFTVISDLHLGDSQPSNWLQWYVSRMELCDFLIMVCCPAFKQVFTCDHPKLPVIDERVSWFFAYRNAMYGDILKEVNQQNGKFIPVLLGDRWPAEDCIPTLFLAGSTYQLGTDGNRSFEFDNISRDFERMVCRMAGINRLELEKEIHGPVEISQTSYAPGANNAAVKKSRRGYKNVQWQPSSNSSPAANQQSSGFAGASHQPQAHYNNPGPAQQPPHVAQRHQYNAGDLSVQQLPHIAQQHQYTPSDLSVQQPQYDPEVHPELPSPESLPATPPSREIIFWLVQNITNWKFIARYLGLSESEIERIHVDNQGDMVEQRYKMFDLWQRANSSPFTYQTLGSVLLKNESNRHLYRELVNKLC